MQVNNLCSLTLLVLGAGLTGCGGSGNGSTGTGPTPPPSTPAVLAVQGTGFTKNGIAFLPKSFQLRGFTVSKAVATAMADNGDNTFQTALNAQAAFGSTELAAASSWGANMLRFQLSQPALDPSGTETIVDQKTGQTINFYDPTYLPTVIAAINQARAAGFLIILSMQDEAGTGTSEHKNLPTQATINAWNQLLPTFGSAPDVMLELYNEPSLSDTPADWNLWAYGGTSSGGTTYIGMQQLIDTLRTASSPAKNIMLLDGLAEAATLAGVPGLATPLTDHSVNGISNQFAYAIHPYPRGISVTDTAAQYTALWDSQFGNFSQQSPVMSTEWSAFAGDSTNSNLGLQGAPTYQVAVDLLDYLVSKRIALGVGAFDIPGVMIQALDGTYTPSNYDNYAQVYLTPGGANENAGLLVQKLYLSPYPAAVLQCSDAVDNHGSNGASCGQ